MKLAWIGGALVAALVGVVVWEEFRIAALEDEVAMLRAQPAVGGARSGATRQLPGTMGGSANASKTARAASGATEFSDAGTSPAPEGREGFGESIRKIFENPAGRAMINEENRAKAARLYAQLIDDFGLQGDDREYFLDLVGAGIGEDDAIGMKMLGAKDDDERIQILDEMEAAQAQRRKDIEAFLNDDGDFAAYERFEERKPDYEQLPGIRAVMQEAGAPMSPEQETALVDAMFEARRETGLTDRWEGRAGFEQFGEAGVSQRFQDDWASMQIALQGNVGEILEDPQREAFRQQQDQVKQFALMGIRMVEGMIEAAERGAPSP